MSDLISRQLVIDLVHKTIYSFFDVVDDEAEEPINEKDELLLELNKALCNAIKGLSSAQPNNSPKLNSDIGEI